MKRVGVACFAGLTGLVVLGALAACRQIVGIGDRSVATTTDAGPAGACGLVFPEGDCNACMQTKCCSAASACATSPACAPNEQCVAACGKDEDCVERCQVSDPVGTVASVPAFDTCLSAHCAQECNLPCGAHTGLAASPDASVPCGACIQANACPAAEACGTDLACETLYRCEVACPTLDCTAACEKQDDAGTQLFQAYGALLLGDCAVACGLGQNWVCAGHVSWPQPKTAGSLSVSATVADLISNVPTAGADVKLCAQDDTTCAHPLDEKPTDATGAVTLDYTLANTIQGGLVGYLQITSNSITPALFFWGFPLSETSASFGIKISTDATGLIPEYLNALGVTLMPGRGVAFVGALDCSHNPAVGVHVNIVSPDGGSGTQILYGVSGGATFSTTATSTDGSGVALLANVPVGPVSIEVVTASGLVVSQQSFFVEDGAEEEVVALPTPP